MRVVLDTNTIVSVLVFPRGRLAWFRPLWTTGRIVPLVCRATARELIDALAYPKFNLNESELQTLLAGYLPVTETIDVTDDAAVDVPLCRDPDDQVFLRLAAIGRAEVLASGDRAILELKKPAPFAIETATQFQKRFA